jgi:hypothetical protein
MIFFFFLSIKERRELTWKGRKSKGWGRGEGG